MATIEIETHEDENLPGNGSVSKLIPVFNSGPNPVKVKIETAQPWIELHQNVLEITGGVADFLVTFWGDTAHGIPNEGVHNGQITLTPIDGSCSLSGPYIIDIVNHVISHPVGPLEKIFGFCNVYNDRNDFYTPMDGVVYSIEDLDIPNQKVIPIEYPLGASPVSSFTLSFSGITSYYENELGQQINNPGLTFMSFTATPTDFNIDYAIPQAILDATTQVRKIQESVNVTLSSPDSSWSTMRSFSINGTALESNPIETSRTWIHLHPTLSAFVVSAPLNSGTITKTFNFPFTQGRLLPSGILEPRSFSISNAYAASFPVSSAVSVTILDANNIEVAVNTNLLPSGISDGEIRVFFDDATTPLGSDGLMRMDLIVQLY